MNEKRFKLWQLLLSDDNLTEESKKYTKFIEKYFANDIGVENLWNWLISHKQPNSLDYYYNNTLEEYYKKFVCGDLEWAKNGKYCKKDKTETDKTEKDKTDKTKVVTPVVKSKCKEVNITGDQLINKTAVVKKCMIGDIVSKIQERLKHHGFPNFSKDGSIDKIYGSRTEEMIKQFQRKVGLKDDGIVGEKTWIELQKDKSQITNKTEEEKKKKEKTDFDDMKDYLGNYDFSNDTPSSSSGSNITGSGSDYNF